MTKPTLREDITYAVAKLTEGRTDGGTIRFAGGHVSEVQIARDAEQYAHFTLTLQRVNINQLSVILGILKRPPVIDITPLTMEGDGTSVAFHGKA